MNTETRLDEIEGKLRQHEANLENITGILQQMHKAQTQMLEAIQLLKLRGDLANA